MPSGESILFVNGVTTQYSYDDNDRLTQAGGEIYSYDNQGNTLSKTIDADITTYAYDAKQKLTQATITEASQTNTVNYLYNVDGIRMAKTENGIATNYLVDSNRDYAQVIAELDDTDFVIKSYTYGSDLLSMNKLNEVWNYQYDGLGSTRSLINFESGESNIYFYDSYGSMLGEEGNTDNIYLYAGEQFDASLDQYYLRARYYDYKIGRFSQADRWEGRQSEPATLNKYNYANLNPVDNIDPSGYITISSLTQASRGMASLSSITIPSYTRELASATVGVSIALLIRDINFNIVFHEADEAPPIDNTSEESQRQKEYEEAKDFCDNQKPIARDNQCSTLSKLIEHAEQCVAMYEAWDNKWYKGRHNEKIRDWKNRVNKLKDEHRRRCTNK